MNMTIIHFSQATFLKSVAHLNHLPPDIGGEVAFIGRSNSGKSSALNAITDIKKLAKTSKTPGRTQLINFFSLTEHERLVDLPGYGYAKVPEAVRQRWQKTFAMYLMQRHSLKGLILIMDIRHPLKPLDTKMLDLTAQRLLPVHILLTKSDKLSRLEANKTLKKTTKLIANYPNRVTIQLFSALKKEGIGEVRGKMAEWFFN